MEMKINTKEFKKFIEKASIDGVIQNLILKFNKDNVSVDLRNEANTLGIAGVIDKSMFTGYEEIGAIAIKKIDIFNNILKFFNGEKITINFEKDKSGEYSRIVISDGMKSYRHILATQDSVEDFARMKFNEIPHLDTIKFNKDTLTDILKVVSPIGAVKMKVVAEDKEISLFIGDDGCEFQTGFSVEKELNDKYNIVLGTQFFDIIKIIEDTIDVRVHTDEGTPIVIFDNQEHCKFVFAIAKRGID